MNLKIDDKCRYIKDQSIYEGSPLWEKKAIGDLVKIWGQKYNNKIALVTENDEMTFTELEELSTKRAYGYQKLGLKQGDMVILQLSNNNEYAVTFFALMKLGVIPILALPAHRNTEISGIMDKAHPVAYIIADKYQGFSYLEMARRLKDEKPFLKNIIVQGENEEFINILDVTAEEGILPEIDGYETALMLLSGGTLGIPKMIPRSHSDYIYYSNLCIKETNVDENSVFLVALPAEHNFPMNNPGIIGTLNAGGKIVFCENPGPDEIFEAISNHGVTITSLVPTLAMLCNQFLDIIDEDEYDLSSLKILQIGGAMLDTTLADEIIERWPCKLMQVYGTSEGLCCMTDLKDSDDILRYYQGRKMGDLTEVRIVDTDGNDVPDGIYGEVICKGPYTIDHYYKEPLANMTSFTSDGFYRTGDRAKRTEDGLYHFGGRVKEQINRAGEKIEPAEVEAFLCTDERILEAAVAGVRDEELGNKICAFIRCQDGEKVTMEDVYALFTKLEVALYKYPDQLVVVDSWPLTKVGKIDKNELIENYI